MVCIGIKYASGAVGVGLRWGGVGGKNVHVNLNICHATLWDLLLLMHTYVMLPCGICSCLCTHTSCYPVGSALALAHIRHATCRIFCCTCAHMSCYTVGSSVAIAHIYHATLWDLLLHLHTYVMLWSSVALAHIRHATLWDLLLHLHTYIMLRFGIFNFVCYICANSQKSVQNEI